MRHHKRQAPCGGKPQLISVRAHGERVRRAIYNVRVPLSADPTGKARTFDNLTRDDADVRYEWPERHVVLCRTALAACTSERQRADVRARVKLLYDEMLELSLAGFDSAPTVSLATAAIDVARECGEGVVAMIGAQVSPNEGTLARARKELADAMAAIGVALRSCLAAIHKAEPLRAWK